MCEATRTFTTCGSPRDLRRVAIDLSADAGRWHSGSMRWAIIAAALAACGGQILDAPNDSGADSSTKADAAKDVSPIDVVTFDVTGADDITTPNLCQLATTNLVAYFPL